VVSVTDPYGRNLGFLHREISKGLGARATDPYGRILGFLHRQITKDLGARVSSLTNSSFSYAN
jgi:hypothetical protein